MYNLKKATILLAATLVISQQSHANTWYVKHDGSSNSNARSWSTASSDLQKIINGAHAGDSIWIAEGTYYPSLITGSHNDNQNTEQRKSFLLKKDIKLFGGFAGVERHFTERIYKNHPTILSGNNGQKNTRDDNAFHVVLSVGDAGTAELNGFTICDGDSHSATREVEISNNKILSTKGAGIYCFQSSPKLSNLTIKSNIATYQGGGIYLEHSASKLINIDIENNSCLQNGGGLYIDKTSTPEMIDISVCHNESSQQRGGGMYCENTNPVVIINGLIAGNISQQHGTGIFCDGRITLINCTIADNTCKSNETAGIYSNNGQTVALKNSIVWGNKNNQGESNLTGNAQFDHCLVENLRANGIISNYNPCFENAGNGNYHLKGHSPAINSGLTIHNKQTTDLNGEPRRYNNDSIDMGPYEYQKFNTDEQEKTRILYVKKGSKGNGSSWNNAFGELSQAIAYCENDHSVDQIWVTGIIGRDSDTGIYMAETNHGHNNNQNETFFVMPANVKIYGGFCGSEVYLDQRDWIKHKTTLSGSYHYHVVVYAGNAGDALLDGFSIQDGVAKNSSTTSVSGVEISNYNGGGILCMNSSPAFNHINVANNSAGDGGGVYCDKNSHPTFKNCVIANNSSDQKCGGLYCENTSPTLINCDIIYNRSGDHSTGAQLQGNCKLYNSIIWGSRERNTGGNPAFDHCLVQGSRLSGESIILNTNPNFKDSLGTNYNLTEISPCINKGDNHIAKELMLDLGFSSRISEGTIDLGAYEFHKTETLWLGFTSDDEDISRNWLNNQKPLQDEYITFATGAANNLKMNGDITMRLITNNGKYHVDLNGHKLTIKGLLIFTGTGAVIAKANNSTMEYGGLAPQSIDTCTFKNDDIYSLIINNPSGVTLHTTLTVNNLTITKGSKLIIPAGKTLIVRNAIINEAGADGLLIQSGIEHTTGTLIFKGSPVEATVEMYCRAHKDANGPDGFKYKWQFFGVPFESTPARIPFDGMFVREHNEKGTTAEKNFWKPIGGGSTLKAFNGYEMARLSEKMLTLKGKLVNKDLDIPLTYTQDAAYPGQHILGNSYTSAIEIAKMEFTNADDVIYLYNTGSYNDWKNNNSNNDNSEQPGHYIACPINLAGKNGIPSQIPSMQGFLVKANGENASLHYNYNNNISNNRLQHTRQRQGVSSPAPECTTIDICGSRYNDRLWLFTNPECTRAYDNGWDARKIQETASRAPEIFSNASTDRYQIDCDSTLNMKEFGIKAGEDSIYTLVIKRHGATSPLYLLDKTTKELTDITADSTSFTFESSTLNTNRFRILNQNNTELTQQSNYQLNAFVSGQNLHIANYSKVSGEVKMYSINGELVFSTNATSLSENNIHLNLSTGVYILRTEIDGEQHTEKAVISHQ